ncbi:acetyltransferase [Rhizobium sp. Root708]|uniref:GNAT family N-acetyltransferase n=1 Tax=Rhizobium sp. Root708 TaxID=1736592 RepID=UPI0007003679|nr:GNAT family protein [Rhizobium sp. Root708]KRB55335.1 acetyltransferase [Rhizobium sp. Root708]
MRDLSNYKVAAPSHLTLKGRYGTVEPFIPEQHLQELWNGLGDMSINPLLRYFAQDDFGGIDDFGTWLEDVKNSGWLTHIFRNNRTAKIVGMASFMRADPANGVVEIGGVAHGIDMQRSAISTEVHYLMARHVFEDLRYRRYEWKCDHKNEPSKTTALRFGFTFEGVFRQHMISKRRDRDTAWFSMIDSEWPKLNDAFEAWLSPENFDAEGKQVRRLADIRATLGQ